MTAWVLEDDGTRADLRPAKVADRWDIRHSATLAVQPPDPRLRRRLARQIRQDIWRAAQRVRGFVPRVRVTQTPDGTLVEAGGVLLVDTPLPTRLHGVLETILSDAQKRRRWLAYAGAASRGKRACSRKS